MRATSGVVRTGILSLHEVTRDPRPSWSSWLVTVIRFVTDRRPHDVVSTVLILNVLFLLLRDEYRISLFGLTLAGPSLLPSLLAVVLWTARGWLWRGPFKAEAAVRWFKGHGPETVVGVLVLLGLALRVWGLQFGDPLIVHPDERQVSGEVIVMLKNGTLAPREPYVYPTAFKYLLLPSFGLYYVWGLSAGLWNDFADIQRDTFGFYLVARVHSAILGTLTILLTYLLARRFWPGERGRWIGAVSAIFVTFSFNAVRQSHFGVTDAPMTFVVMLAFVAMAAMYREGRTRDYAISGLLVGMACATKYNALPIVLVLVVAHFLGRPAREWLSSKLVVGVGAVPAGFFLGYPYALLNWRPFLDHLGKWGNGPAPSTLIRLPD